MVFLPAPDTCKWLPVSSLTVCNKSCYGDYCGIHAYAIKKNPQSGPRPCLVCQRGVKGPIQLCGKCGGAHYRSLLSYYKTRSPKYYHRTAPPTVEEFLASRNSTDSA